MKKCIKLIVSLIFFLPVVVFAANDALPPPGQMTQIAPPATQSDQQLLQQLTQQLNKKAAGDLSAGNDSAATVASPVPDQASVAAANVQNTAATDASGTATSSAATPATDSNSDLSMQAFLGVLNKQLPLSADQIATLHKAFQETQKAAATPSEIPARPTTSSVLVNLSPNAVPPIIRLGAGYISSLVFVDSTGQPWPIDAYSVGDPSSFNIQWDKKSNTLLVQASSFYKRSNLAVILKGLNTPVMLTLLPGQTAVDYRVDLRIPGVGPNAVLMRDDLPNAEDPVLLEILNGVPPKQSKTLKVLGDNSTQAWLLNDKLYLRTPLTILSPAWKSVMSSIDGMHAYELQPASVILALENGKDKTVKLILEGLS